MKAASLAPSTMRWSADPHLSHCPTRRPTPTHRAQPSASIATPPPDTSTGTMLLPESMDPTLLTVRRSEEHTSELQSHSDLVCRLLLETKQSIHTRLTHAY